MIQATAREMIGAMAAMAVMDEAWLADVILRLPARERDAVIGPWTRRDFDGLLGTLGHVGIYAAVDSGLMDAAIEMARQLVEMDIE